MALKFHEWNQSDFSRKFSGITTAVEFVIKWLEEMSTSSDSAEKHVSQPPASSRAVQHDSLSPFPSLTSPQSLPERASTKRRRSENVAVSSQSSSGMGLLNESSPSKRCKFIKEGIDGRIERNRKGKS